MFVVFDTGSFKFAFKLMCTALIPEWALWGINDYPVFLIGSHTPVFPFRHRVELFYG